jgi:hypothetical protein
MEERAMRWAVWTAVAAALICGCAPAVERAAEPDPGLVDGPRRLTRPSVAGEARGYRPARRIWGSVTAADPEHGLVVLNVGERDGVRERYAFTVYRDRAYIGKVVVVQVFPDYCAARYGRAMRADVTKGDTAATRLAGEF